MLCQLKNKAIMELCKTTRDPLKCVFKYGEVLFNKLIDDYGMDGKFDVQSKIPVIWTPCVYFFNADGEIDRNYLTEIGRDDGDLMFVFDDETYCELEDLVPQSMFQAIYEIFEGMQTSLNEIEKEIFG